MCESEGYDSVWATPLTNVMIRVLTKPPQFHFTTPFIAAYVLF